MLFVKNYQGHLINIANRDITYGETCLVDGERYEKTVWARCTEPRPAGKSNADRILYCGTEDECDKYVEALSQAIEAQAVKAPMVVRVIVQPGTPSNTGVKEREEKVLPF